MRLDREGKQKLLAWQRSVIEVANSIGYRMIDDRDVPDLGLGDIARFLESLAIRVRREMEDKDK